MTFKKLFALSMLISLFSVSISYACTNFLVTKGASVDGSTMISYNADAGGFMEPLYFMPAQDHAENDSVDIYEWDTGKYLGKIKQVPHTYSVVGNMNEWQLSIGETTFGGHKELRDTTAIMDYGSLMYIALQRAKTAREAIKVITDLVEEYGYYSSGESFSIADPNEVWIFEIISKGMKEKGAVWVARKVPDGYVCAHANQARISDIPMDDKENCMYAEDVIEFAEEMKYYDEDKDGEFSFVKAYNPLDAGGALFCEGRVWSMFRRAAPSLNLQPEYWRAHKGESPYPLFIKPDKKLSVEDVVALNRDHFQGTEWDMTKGLGSGPFGCPYRWKPLVWKMESDTVNKYAWNRPISTQQTAFAFVSQMRSDLPREIGGCFWYGVDDTYTNVYMPLYCSMTEAPKSYIRGSNSEFDFESAFWVFNLVANRAYTKYEYIVKDIQIAQNKIEGKFHSQQKYIEEAAMKLYKEDPKKAVEFLTNYSVDQAETTVDIWRDLWKYIVVKYNDGYINDVNEAGGRHPKGVGYGDEFFQKLIKDRPGYYDLKWIEKK